MIVIFPKYRHNNGIERRNESNDSFGSLFTFRFAVTPTLNEIFSNFQSVTSNQVKNKISSVAANACMLLQKVYLPIISKMKGSSIDKLLQSLNLTNQVLNSSEQSFRNVQLTLPSSLTYKLTQSGTIHYNIDYNSQHLLERTVLLLENGQDISSMILELSVIPSVVRQSELYLELIMNKVKYVLSLLTEIRWRTVTCPSNEKIKLTGLDAEIEFWRNANVQLATLLKTVSHPRHKVNVYLLRAAISSNKLLEWFNCEKRLVSNLCETQENFKYLLSLSKISSPIYGSDPVMMKQFLPSLMYSVKLMCKLSRYYSEPQHMSDLLLCLCAQIVQCCKKCLTCNVEDNLISMKDQTFELVEEVCHMHIDLTNELLEMTVSGTREKAASSMPLIGHVYMAMEALDNVSTEYTFSPINMFLLRIQKIIHVRNTIKKYGSQLNKVTLRDFSMEAEHLEELLSKLIASPDSFSEHYTLLLKEEDPTFERWYKDIFLSDLDILNKALIESLEYRVHKIFKSKCRSINEVLRCLKSIKSMEINDLRKCVIKLYSEVVLYIINTEFPLVMSIYEREKRNASYFNLTTYETVSQIQWVRGLYYRIKKPVNEILSVDCISDAEKDLLKREFDKRAQTLTMHELLTHRHWLQSLEHLPNALKSPIFIENQQEDSKQNYYSAFFRINETVESINLKNGLSLFRLNFDPFIECAAHTTRELLDMNISCPSICVDLLNNWSNLEANAYRLRNIVRIYNDIQIRSSERTYRNVIKKLFCEYPSKLYSLLQEGKIIYNWQSPGLTKYTGQCELEVDMMENLVYRVEWLVANRIHRHLDTLFNISLMTIPNVTSKTHMSNYNGQQVNEKHQCITLEEFAQLTKKDTLTAAVSIAALNSKIENAVLDLIEMFTEACDDQAGSITFQPCHGSTVKLGRLGKLQRSIVQTFALTDKGLRKIHQLRSIPTSQQTIEDSENKSNEDGKQLQEINGELARVWNYYEGRMTEGLIYITINSLDKLREHLLSRKRVQLNKVEKCKTALYVQSSDALNDEHVQTPVFCVDVILEDQIIKLSSSVDKLQHSVNQVLQYILNVSKGVKRWGQSKELKADMIHCIDYPGRLDAMRGDIDVFQLILKKLSTLDCKFVPENAKSTDVYNLFELPLAVLYNDIRTDVEVNRIYKDLSNCIAMNKEIFESSLQYLYKYSYIWQSDETISDKIVAIKREDFEIMSILNGLSELDNMVKSVQQIEDYQNIFPLKLIMTPFKSSIVQQAVNRKLKACEHVKKLLIENASSIHMFMQRLIKKLDKELRSVDDFKTVLSAINATRSSQPKIERSCMKLRTAFNAIAYHYPEAQQSLRPFNITDKSEELARSYEELIANTELAHYDILKSRSMFVNDLLNDIEVFSSELNEFDNQYQTTGPMIEGVAAKEASDRMRLFSSKFDLLWHRYRSLYEGEQLFNLPHRKFNRLYFLKKELTSFNRLYALFDQANQTIDRFKDTVWSKINISLMTDEISDLMSRCKRMPTSLKKWPAYRELSELIAEFLEKIPLLEMLSNKAMQIRHWQNMESIFNLPLNVSDDAFPKQIEDVCIRAMKEQEIEAKLNSLESEWRTREFKLAPFKMRGDIILKGQDTSEAISAIEDSNLILASLASNRYNEHFKADIQKCIDDLAITYEVTTKWIQVQNLWVYLEAVFIGGDISRQLPLEARKFNAVDKMWLKMITKVKETPNILSCCISYDNNLEMLDFMLSQLDMCQTSLAGYLESKRLIFPRFYFLSDPVLLEILGQASEPIKLQPYFNAFTESVNSVKFNESSKETEDYAGKSSGQSQQHSSILAIQSEDNEVLELVRPVYTKKTTVEEWLGDFLLSCQDTVEARIQKCVASMGNSEFDLQSFFLEENQQFGLIILQLLWTATSENAIKNQLKTGNSVRKASKYFQLLLDQLIERTVDDLSSMNRLKYDTYITIHIHQRDVFSDLANLNLKDVRNFDWTKQSRFYYEDVTNSMVVSITDVDFMYGNEFLGCSERLVITPLTDRCYISLAQALGMCYGGSPAGPAGTGKTETTKDMAKSIGKYCIVLNCSEQFDYKGLAQQIQTLLHAKRNRHSELIFTDGQRISMDTSFAIIITMNPGYAGRQELPENLKVNFRVVAMMVSDRQIIIRVKLASCGFKNNVILSQKFYLLYKLCEDQLSKQVHYDFGMRNVRAVLRTLGTAKRQNAEEEESVAVLRVLRDMNLSKLVDEDEPLFLSLLNDLFPSVSIKANNKNDLQVAIDFKCNELNLCNHADWNLKILQLYDTQLVRHGIMVLGPSGVGKSSCITVLQGALTIMGTLTREYRMNPKAITSAQMFGELDVATNDWTDGIFSILWRRFLKMYSNSVRKQRKEAWWMVLDGPVDAVWIENLNSVLDDNKLLTLANGDRIPMATNVKVIFEVHNIDNASPATVSRNASDKDKKYKNAIYKILDNVFDKLEQYVRINLSPTMSAYECNYISQMLSLTDGMNAEFDQCNGNEDVLKRLSSFTIIWSFGALLELDDRSKLEVFIRDNLSDQLNLNDQSFSNTIVGNSTQSVFDHFLSKEGVWEHWSRLVNDWKYPMESESLVEYSKILVPNVDNVRTMYLVDSIAKQKKPVLLVGEPGTAKTVIINNYMSTSYDATVHECRTMNFSSATTPNQIQRTLESYFDKRVANTIGPAENKHMTIFIDDLSMPMVNEWGDQTANEVVRQVIEFNGFYSLDKPGEWTNIVDIQFLAAMIKPGGGRNNIPERLRRHFITFNCTLPGNEAMDKIFMSIANYFHESRGFSLDVINACSYIVEATRQIWQAVKLKMLPTPAKFHYIFNLRDLSKIWEGIIRISSAECSTVKELVHLWRHECSRVLSDRLIIESEIEWFKNVLNDETAKLTHRLIEKETEHEAGVNSVRESFASIGDSSRHKINAVGIISSRSDAKISLKKSGDMANSYEDELFCDFQRAEIEVTDDNVDNLEAGDSLQPRVYERVLDMENIRNILKNNMERMNVEVRGNNMDIVFFDDSIKHLLRVSRIITKPKGHALLVGVGGSGKRSMAALAAYICGHKIFKIMVTRIYNVASFLEDMRLLYKMVAKSERGVSFILADTDINDEQYLEYVNNMLNTGEIPGLLGKEDYEPILNELAFSIKRMNPKAIITRETLMQHYWQRIRANLHIILCLSPENKRFRERAMKFPGLISGCTIDWYHKWPIEALTSVCSYYLHKFEMDCRPSTKTAVIKVMSQIHDDISTTCSKYFELTRRLISVTPKSFLSFITSYQQQYMEKREYLEKEKAKMKIGIDKLHEAAEQVNSISAELVGKGKEIEDLNSIASEELRSTEGIKKNAEQQEERALLEITKPDIDYLKKLPNPPQLIMIIIDSILILLRYRVGAITINTNVGSKLPPFYNTNNSEISKMLGNPQIMKMLYELNPDELNDEILELTGAYFKYVGYDYNMAYKVFKNLAPLTNWAKKMEQYYDKNKAVLPLKNNVRKLEFKHKKAQLKLNKAEAEYQKTNQILQKCLVQYRKAMDEKKVVQDQYDALQHRRDTAASLIDGLTDERKRWSRQSIDFERTIKRLPGDVLLATAFICYAGPFSQNFRNLLTENWLKIIRQERIPLTDRFDIVNNMVDEARINEWNLEGLPADRLSTENGIIITKNNRYPLLIDPQLQGKTWIVNKESQNDLIITQLNSKSFRDQLEKCLSGGQTLLIEDVEEELDPTMDNVLDKKYFKLGTSMKCKIGDRDVDVNDNFMLYITTKLSNPEFPPETFARCAVIDFAVTMLGLEEQLLAIVINHERAEIERERVITAKEMSANQKRLKELENSLLFKLTSIEGSVLDDLELIRVLNENKSTANDIKQKMMIAEKTRVKLEFAREEYRSVAIRGSVLYFIITEMALVNHMYQTSLHQFLEIFNESMDSSYSNSYSIKSTNSNQRANDIVKLLTEMTWNYVSRAIYRHDRLLFTLLLALKIKLRSGDIKINEFMAFVKGGASIDLDSCPPKRYSWIDNVTWMNLVEISHIPRFRNIMQHLKENESKWKVWQSSSKIEETNPPIPLNEGINYEFDRLLMVRVWSPDKIIVTAQTFIAHTIGKQFVQPYILRIEDLVNESNSKKPILALLSSGNDPTNSIVSIAAKKCKEISIVALGQGQEQHARSAMLHAMQTGNWILLQNCHLGLDYLNEFYVELNTIDSHQDFRAWLTTEYNEYFPIQMLQCAIKFTNEAPQGIRAGLFRTYQNVTQEFIEAISAKPWPSLIYSISYLHSVFQERRKYGPMGWNVPYEFSQTDWEASLKYIRNLLARYDKNPIISWKALRYMIGEIQYGGRVTDDMDRRLILSYSKLWFKEALLTDRFDFCPPTNIYSIPQSSKMKDILAFISNLPITDKARIFGLHANSDMSYQIMQSSYALSTIVSIQPKDESSTIIPILSKTSFKNDEDESKASAELISVLDQSRETNVKRIAADMLTKLPENLSELEIRKRLQIMGSIQPMSIFLTHEINRMQKLLNIIRQSLTDVILAIDGVIVLSDELKQTVDNIYDGRIPIMWTRYSWISEGLGFWFSELVSRNTQFENWIRKGRPKLFWFAGFFNPSGFLTAMRQEITRSHHDWALDFVTVESTVTRMNKEDVRQAPTEGVYIYGMYLEGAAWNPKQASLCEPANKILYHLMPVIHMYAVNEQSKTKKQAANITPIKSERRANRMISGIDKKQRNSKTVVKIYDCPVYKRNTRTDENYITSIQLNSGNEDPLHWILRGAALINNVN
ncbi:hypothetical protein GJ496_006330 [Pomphorhynchus laevis]|nr:hypothetical protein GJ496_006330 [Pomphorhynchus laevis]